MIQIRRNNLDELADIFFGKIMNKDSDFCLINNIENFIISTNLEDFYAKIKDDTSQIKEIKDSKDKIKYIQDKYSILKLVDTEMKNIKNMFHGNNNLETIQNNIKKCVEGNKGNVVLFFKDLTADVNLLKELISQKPLELLSISTDIDKKYIFSNTEKSIILDVFRYSDFRSSEVAYWFGKNINSNVCPYCNREHTFTYRTNNNKPKLLYDLDHFFDKATYPYLSLSFYNLVSSCGICNSNFKGKNTFNLSDNFHPYIEGFSDELRFTIVNSKNDVEKNITKYNSKISGEDLKKEVEKSYGTALFHGNLDSFNIDFKYKKDATPAEKQVADKALKKNGNVDIFQLKEVYNQHKDYVWELIQKSMIYNESYLESLYKQFEGTLFKNKEDVIRLVLGNYITEEDLGKRPLAKLTRDISEELGLL